ncbi:S24 family peptidase [uncultured Mailhella sp.]|uniref:S24 family peptidase n=1 Tax=uncultured Mailhella sp. TaxID=1981031 RepID=UPI002617F70C|nr:S24 family peptidase [uncultured Mailhella sp.]
MEDFAQHVMELIRQAVETEFNGNVSRASQAWGITGDNLHKWLRGDRVPTLSKISPILNRLGASLSLAHHDAGRDVCFVDARLAPAGEHAAPPAALDYMAAPLVGEAGAGPGYLPQEEIKSWFLVYKHQAAVRYRRNLIAVEIGPASTSMRPTLNPGDIVLVDRDDRDVSQPGHMMLVLDPMDGSGMIKRVSVTDLKKDCRITYYSDNALENPPQIYSLQNDFGGDFERCIVGRVVWAWSDMKGK